jgi:hypothetical protein
VAALCPGPPRRKITIYGWSTRQLKSGPSTVRRRQPAGSPAIPSGRLPHGRVLERGIAVSVLPPSPDLMRVLRERVRRGRLIAMVGANVARAVLPTGSSTGCFRVTPGDSLARASTSTRPSLSRILAGSRVAAGPTPAARVNR